MRRWGFFLYGVSCHLLFVATFAALAGFVGGFVLPKSIDGDPAPWYWAILIDSMLIALFGVQHSVMARPAFKQLWTRFVPKPIERSTYVLISCLLLLFLMWQWRGIDWTVWEVQHPIARGLLWGVHATGWLLVFFVSLMINHFDLFGTRQVWLYLRGLPYTPLPFRTPLLYSRMRHPLYVGWAIAFWATPTMGLAHFLFAGLLTFYMALATRHEERDLVALYGDQYREYQVRVPMYLPGYGRRAGASGRPPAAALPDAGAE